MLKSVSVIIIYKTSGDLFFFFKREVQECTDHAKGLDVHLGGPSLVSSENPADFPPYVTLFPCVEFAMNVERGGDHMQQCSVQIQFSLKTVNQAAPLPQFAS